MEKKFFGKLENGTEIYSYVLSNGKMKAEILNLGGTVRVLECDGVDVVGGYVQNK